ncbi:hypothetical protein TNCV_4714821 [Trichonephila clavipes]|nr:hypothetical protein TNCV_4714821 [Trichonephila clavipes]
MGNPRYNDVSRSAVYFTAIDGDDWSGRCDYTWHLPDVPEVFFPWVRSRWLLSDWLLSGDDSDSDWLTRGFKKLHLRNWEELVQLGNRSYIR